MIAQYQAELQASLDAIGGARVIVLDGVKELSKQDSRLRVILDDSQSSGTFAPGAGHFRVSQGSLERIIYTSAIDVSAHIFGDTYDDVWCVMANVIAAFTEMLGGAGYIPLGFKWFDDSQHAARGRGLTLASRYFIPITDTPQQVKQISGIANETTMTLPSGEEISC